MKILIATAYTILLGLLLSYISSELILGNIVEASVELGFMESSRILYLGIDSNGDKVSNIKIGDEDYKKVTKKYTRPISLLLLPVAAFLAYRISFHRLHRCLIRKQRHQFSILDQMIIKITTVIALWLVAHIVLSLFLILLHGLLSIIIVGILQLIESPKTEDVANFAVKMQYDFINHNINGIMDTIVSFLTLGILSFLSFKEILPWCRNDKNGLDI